MQNFYHIGLRHLNARAVRESFSLAHTLKNPETLDESRLGEFCWATKLVRSNSHYQNVQVSSIAPLLPNTLAPARNRGLFLFMSEGWTISLGPYARVAMGRIPY